MKVAVTSRKAILQWKPRLRILLEAISRSGVEVCWYAPLLEALETLFPGDGEAHILPSGGIFTCQEDLPDDVDLLVALGGDGTFLSALTFVRDRGIPVAGINFGRLGFLTTAVVSEEGDNGCLDRLLAGEYRIEERTLLNVSCTGIPGNIYPYAINEVSIQRMDPHMLGVNLSIDGTELPTYWADGLVISTDTGSTAYSLSIGGPIAMPGSDILIIAPIAPHNLNVRPLIVSGNSSLELQIKAKRGKSYVTLDNRQFCMDDTDVIKVSKAPFRLRCAVLSESSFMDALREKLLWGQDKRNIGK